MNVNEKSFVVCEKEWDGMGPTGVICVECFGDEMGAWMDYYRPP
jgi:hypothetical protein